MPVCRRSIFVDRYDFSKPTTRRARPNTKLAWSPRAASDSTVESPPSRISPRVMNWKSAVRRLSGWGDWVVSCAETASGNSSSEAIIHIAVLIRVLSVHL